MACQLAWLIKLKGSSTLARSPEPHASPAAVHHMEALCLCWCPQLAALLHKHPDVLQLRACCRVVRLQA